MVNVYQNQIKLLLTCLPIIADLDRFALKGGTAINLFERQDFPRVSVDIDLVYLPIEDRKTTLINMENELLTIKHRIQQSFPELKVGAIKNNTTKTITKLVVAKELISIKIEPNLILRGTVYPIRKVDLSKKVILEYGMSILNMPTVSRADLYAGKILAALDRQHPRDLFDIMILLADQISMEIKLAFLIYLISHNRPMHELLCPNRLDQREAYNSEFLGMTNTHVPYEELEAAREKLINVLNTLLTNEDKEFLLSVKRGEPKWEHLGFSGIDKLPGVAWKLINIKKMDKVKHNQMLQELKRVLYA